MREKQNQPFQLSFNASLRIDFQGSRVTSDGGLILVRELDERLGLGVLITQPVAAGPTHGEGRTHSFRWPRAPSRGGSLGAGCGVLRRCSCQWGSRSLGVKPIRPKGREREMERYLRYRLHERQIRVPK
ncbi:MAG: transposase [Acidobacteriia bacterium]|nr:transposase [Terriglobia bacterium]